MYHYFPDKDELVQAVISHVVKATSKGSADSPIARRRGQAEIEAGLAAAGIPHTLLRSNAHMQNVLALAPAIAGTSSFGSAAGKGRVGMVDARDVAAVAAAIASAPAPHARKIYWLSGPEQQRRLRSGGIHGVRHRSRVRPGFHHQRQGPVLPRCVPGTRHGHARSGGHRQHQHHGRQLRPVRHGHLRGESRRARTADQGLGRRIRPARRPGQRGRPRTDPDPDERRLRRHAGPVRGTGAGRCVAEPEEIAAAIAYLASDEASFIHGATIPVDGGRTAT